MNPLPYTLTIVVMPKVHELVGEMVSQSVGTSDAKVVTYRTRSRKDRDRVKRSLVSLSIGHPRLTVLMAGHFNLTVCFDHEFTMDEAMKLVQEVIDSVRPLASVPV